VGFHGLDFGGFSRCLGFNGFQRNWTGKGFTWFSSMLGQSNIFYVIFLSIFRQHIGFVSVFNGRIGFKRFFHGQFWFSSDWIFWLFHGRFWLSTDELDFVGFFTDSSGFLSDELDFVGFFTDRFGFLSD
jgi:hypothetical protein